MTRKCVVSWGVEIFVVDVFERSWPRLIFLEWLFWWLWWIIVSGFGPIVVDERS
ncbi:unnamed protein product [Meloidogyne enterolobii]|uniref:Uncharacterized protein n=1 Tax=Meloidogyne enterolobii TaxID=390850 RepID=A0ACB0ZFZ7_MELEN